MAAQEQETKKPKNLKIVIVILAVLLVLSAGGLAARYLYLAYFAPAQSTVVVPDNLIGDDSSRPDGSTPSVSSPEVSDPVPGGPGPSQATGGSPGPDGRNEAGQHTAAKLELYQGQPEDNQRFEVGNMLPGDTETKYFCLKAYHDKDMDLYFQADITGQTKNLGSVLHIKVTHLETGMVLCDAPFAEIDGREFFESLQKTASGETTAYYRIDVSLDTSVGNEHQAAQLQADFKWYVKDKGGLTSPPQTGDTTNITLWMILAASSLLLIILLWKRRKEDGRYE